MIEDRDETFAFVNPRQLQEGAALVIPTRHAPTLFDLTEAEAVAVMQCVVRVARALQSAFQPDGLQLLQNNGVAGAQSVPHFHMHIVPRYRDDSWSQAFHEDMPRTPIEARIELAARVRRHL